ncbi:MAG: hypothetical protein OXU75_08530 [Deltaproteobacteria bacterium]|nr:hypothetical protein [Deltaproteobacteria bacterium]
MQATHGLVLGMEGIDGGDAASKVAALGEFAHGRDLLLLESTSTFPRTRPVSCSTAATITRCPSSVCFEAPRRSLPSMATGACAVLAGPLADGVVQGLWRQRGEDVVEGGDGGRGVAPRKRL